MSNIYFLHTAHKELWNWLTENPGEPKDKWPGWDTFDDVKNLCFACSYAKQVTGGLGTLCGNCHLMGSLGTLCGNCHLMGSLGTLCGKCPLVWPIRYRCCDVKHSRRRGMYDVWDDLTNEILWMKTSIVKKYDFIIAKKKKIVAGIAARIRDLPVREGVKCI